MVREGDIKKRVEKWKRNCPPEEDIADVWSVAMYYFPLSEVKKGGGSHLRFVIWPEHRELARLYDRQKLYPFEWNNKFCLPLVSGKRVKAVYIKNLLKAIEWKEQFDEISSKKGG